jgi:CheY-like chemotaxis protein
MLQLLESPWEDLTHPVIAVVEDSDEDFYIFLRILRSLEASEDLLIPYPFLHLSDGDEALDYLLRQGEYEGLNAPLPAFVLLDLNLPGTDGRDVIYQIKQTPHLRTLPIIVLTTSNNTQDVQTCYRYGVNSYVLKPLSVAQMQKTIQGVLQFWLQIAILPSNEQ